MKDIFKDDDTFLARWLNDELSSEELKAFEASEEYAMYKKIADRSEHLDVGAWKKEAVWNAIQSEHQSDSGIKTSEPTKQSVFHIVRWAAAACVLLLLGYFAFFTNSDIVRHESLAAEMQIHTLPDGSTVHLNADSRLKYNAKTFLRNKILELEGEAFFEVVRGGSFTVDTKNGDVRVLGTSFNVKSRSNRLLVYCYTGRVGVSLDGFKSEGLLYEGEQVISENGKLGAVIELDSELTRPEWKDGSSKFNDSEFDEVLKELERQFDIQIRTETSVRGIDNYNGGFAHDDLTAALEVVLSAYKLKYRIEGKTVVIYKDE